MCVSHPTQTSALIYTVSQRLAESVENQEMYKTTIDDYNAKLVGLVDSFRSAHPDVQTWLMDTHEVVSQLLDDPTEYGFRDATTFGADDDLMWCMACFAFALHSRADGSWHTGNNYHLSSAAHRFIAAALQESLEWTGFL